jgi:hypothetical protein
LENEEKTLTMKRFIILLLIAPIITFMLTACNNVDEIYVTVKVQNATDYEINGLAFQICKGYRMNNPMRGPDDLVEPIKPGEEQTLTFNIPENNLDGEWGVNLTIPGIEDYFACDGLVCFEIASLIVITCDDEMNFTIASYMNSQTDAENYDDVGGGLVTAGIILDFSFGSPEAVLRQETEYAYGEIDIEHLAECLDWFTALDFTVTFSTHEDGGIIVDWKMDSSLLLGTVPEEHEKRLVYHSDEIVDELRFSDPNKMRWFMMDSMYRTIQDNGYPDVIYYTMDGGNELIIEGLSPVSVFPSDIPYMGSAFYFAHANTQGDALDGIME